MAWDFSFLIVAGVFHFRLQTGLQQLRSEGAELKIVTLANGGHFEH